MFSAARPLFLEPQDARSKMRDSILFAVLRMPYKTRRDAQILCRAISWESNFRLGIIIWLIPRTPGSEQPLSPPRRAEPQGAVPALSTRSASGNYFRKPGGSRGWAAGSVVRTPSALGVRWQERGFVVPLVIRVRTTDAEHRDSRLGIPSGREGQQPERSNGQVAEDFGSARTEWRI